MKIAVRDFRDEDLSQIKELILNAENFGPDFLESELERIQVFRAFPNYGRILVAYEVENQTILGFAAIRFNWKALIIESIISHHNYLRKGIGKKLVEKIVKIGEDHPVFNVIRVDTGDFMKYAQSFYLACGFQISGFVSHDLSWFNHQVHFSYPLKRAQHEN